MRTNEEHYFKKESYCILCPETVIIPTDSAADAIYWHKDVLNHRAVPLIIDARIVTEINLERILRTARKSSYPLVKILHVLGESAVGKEVNAHNEMIDATVIKLAKNCESIAGAKTKYEDLPYYKRDFFNIGKYPCFRVASEHLMFVRRRYFDLTDRVLGRGIIDAVEGEPIWNTEKKVIAHPGLHTPSTSLGTDFSGVWREYHMEISSTQVRFFVGGVLRATLSHTQTGNHQFSVITFDINRFSRLDWLRIEER